MAYQAAGVPLVVIGDVQCGRRLFARLGGEGHGAARDQGGDRRGFERIHRSNLVGMGVIPFEFTHGDNRKTLGLKGDEVISISGLAGDLKPLSLVPCTITYGDGRGRSRRTSSAGSIPRSRSSMSSTAGCCTMCCATSLRADVATHYEVPFRAGRGSLGSCGEHRARGQRLTNIGSRHRLEASAIELPPANLI